MILAFLISFLIGYFIISLIDKKIETGIKAFLSLPIGFFLTSIFYFVFLLLNITNLSYYKLFEVLLLLSLAIIYFKRNHFELKSFKFPKISFWYVIVNIYALSIFLKYFIQSPFGSWDGLRIWNIKAEFLYQDVSSWKNIFLLPHYFMHNDYPLFLPCSTARLWQYSANDSIYANFMIGLLFTFGLGWFLYYMIDKFKSSKLAYLVSSIFLLSPTFLYNGASQCADIPLAYFLFAAIACLFFYFDKDESHYIFLGIFLAGASCWIKNEGLLFFAIYFLLILACLIGSRKTKMLKTAILSSALPLLLLLLYKFINQSGNDLYSGIIEEQTYRYLLDFERYKMVFSVFVKTLIENFSWLLLYFLLLLEGFHLNNEIKTPFYLSGLTLILMSFGYLFVYVITPHNLEWLLVNSLDRLVFHLLPLTIFLYCLALKMDFNQDKI